MAHVVPILYGSLRRDRKGIRAARFVEAQLHARGHEPHVVDALDLSLPLLDCMYKEYAAGEAPDALERLAALYRRADGFIVVAGEYNHSIQPGLKNLLDHFLEEYFFRPSAIVCYSVGAFGGLRAAMQLRAVLGEVGMPSISSILPIPRIESTLDESGQPLDPAYERRIGRFLDEFAWWAEATRQQRAKGTPY